jgi:hypothetical protein
MLCAAETRNTEIQEGIDQGLIGEMSTFPEYISQSYSIWGVKSNNSSEDFMVQYHSHTHTHTHTHTHWLFQKLNETYFLKKEWTEIRKYIFRREYLFEERVIPLNWEYQLFASGNTK